MTSMAKKVKAGAELLDERRPGWAKEINLATLNLEECDECIQGQLYGEFQNAAALQQLGVADIAHGFTLPFCTSDWDWLFLTELWKQEIIKRTGETTDGN